MIDIYFCKMKGKPIKQEVVLSIKNDDSVIRLKDGRVGIKCVDIKDYKECLIFFKRFIFNYVDEDIKNKIIYIPKSYILKVVNVKKSPWDS